ncbi:MAG: hypothetical protein AAGG48_07890 [Planctomycetota bacterium]
MDQTNERKGELRQTGTRPYFLGALACLSVALLSYKLGIGEKREVSVSQPEAAPAEKSQQQKSSTVVADEPATKGASTLLGLRIKSEEEREAERRERLERDQKAKERWQQKAVSDFASWSVGQRWIGDSVNSATGKRYPIAATLVAKSGSVEDNSAELILKTESDEAEWVRIFRGKFSEYAARSLSLLGPSSGSFGPTLRFVDVAAEGVPKRSKGPAFFLSPLTSFGLDAEGNLVGNVKNRYRTQENESFTLRPAAIVSKDLASEWKDVLAPGRVWAGNYDQFKRMGYNEESLQVPASFVVAAGENENERLLIVTRKGLSDWDRAIYHVTLGDEATMAGWYVTGSLQLKCLGEYDDRTKPSLTDGSCSRGSVRFAARITDSGELAILIGENGSGMFQRTSRRSGESAAANLSSLTEQLQDCGSLYGQYTIPAKHDTSRRKDKQSFTMPVTLRVVEAGPRWKILILAKGKIPFRATFEGEMVTDRFKQLQFPLRLRRTDLHTKAIPSRVTFIGCNPNQSSELWFRMDEIEGKSVLFGLTPGTLQEQLRFTIPRKTKSSASAGDLSRSVVGRSTSRMESNGGMNDD